MAEPTYFTCTLGQAALLPPYQKKSFKNISDFVDKQASRVPNLPAAGFYGPGNNAKIPWTNHVLTFSDIYKGSCVVAEFFRTISPPGKRQTVALLCPSTEDFLFVWLALMRLGHSVLLLAPQCSPSAITHLCRTCEADLLFYDDMYEDLAIKSSTEASARGEGSLGRISIQSILLGSIYDAIGKEPEGTLSIEDISIDDVAYLHHTSGTSSGVPKPIPQTHRAALGVLPTLCGKKEASFTTTPLYHGGIADLFRAWSSDAMIWLFPGKGVPITPSNIKHCLKTAQESHQIQGTPRVKYFSSVPYVLQMMVADEECLVKLQAMDIVGVGGAALPVEIGDKLVQQEVNLISRFGSAECGFLMSSHRNYPKDKDWQYLRPGDALDTISFEPREDGLSELVILPGWPHMAKKNRADGSYATADLFEPHQSIKHAWRYHSRADSQLTLITGKKFDPAPLEEAIATSRLLHDTLIFGNGKPYPGALLFRSKEAENLSDEDLIAQLEAMVGKINVESQSHVRLARNMLVPMQFSDQPLEKSSKGTILRRKVEERYEVEIEHAYTRVNLNDGEFIEDNEVSLSIQKLVVSIIGKGGNLYPGMDLFSYGVDSVACVQIRHALLQLLPEKSRDLPLTVVEDCGTVSKLAEFIVSRRNGMSYVEEDQHKLMLDLVQKYSNFLEPRQINGHRTSSPTHDSTETPSNEVILLTGATGALGAHILHLYLASPAISQIILLVRSASVHAATQRVQKSLFSHKLRPLTPKVTILPSDLSSPTLGLDESTYATLTSKITTIHHVAWAVNFRLSVSSFASNLASVQNLINLALSSPHRIPPNLVFCSSVASIANTSSETLIPESLSRQPSDASPLGYARSKWIAERVCGAAAQTTRLRGRMAVMRVGQLSGASDTGIWNGREAYPLMLRQVALTHTLPDLADADATLGWLPLELAARSFLEVARGMTCADADADGAAGEMRVYHIVNPDRSAHWTDLLRWTRTLYPRLEAVPPRVFVARLEQLQRDGKEHPAMSLIPHWKVAYGSDRTEGERADVEQQDAEQKGHLVFKMEKSYSAAPVLREVQSVSEEYFGKIWRWVQELEHTHEPSADGPEK